jgi:hypothetical protein
MREKESQLRNALRFHGARPLKTFTANNQYSKSNATVGLATWWRYTQTPVREVLLIPVPVR